MKEKEINLTQPFHSLPSADNVHKLILKRMIFRRICKGINRWVSRRTHGHVAEILKRNCTLTIKTLLPWESVILIRSCPPQNNRLLSL